MKLNTEKLEAVFCSCLFKEDEDKSGAVIAEGVTSKFGFHPDRLKDFSGAINDMLDELPATFHENGGGGMSFLNACMDKDGHQWGEHRNIEQLMCLGLAMGRVKYGFKDRKMWAVLPGGMPYFTVKKRIPKNESYEVGHG